jgi:hypothetical protein
LLNSLNLYQANYRVEKDSIYKLNKVIQTSLTVDFMTITRSYQRNEYGLFNLSGNIAEMVYENYNSKTECGTAGGSWQSNAEEIKIFGPDPYADISDPHPAIGFRVVIALGSLSK